MTRLNVKSSARVAMCVLFSLGSLLASAESTENQMMDACIEKFVATNLANYQGKVVVHKYAFGVHQPLVLSSNKQFQLSAVHTSTGEDLGSVVCSVARNGEITITKPKAAAALKLARLPKIPVMTAVEHNAGG